MDYCDVFISCLDSHSDGTHSLQRTHWWASDVMLNFTKSVMKKLIYILDGLRVSIFSRFSFLGHWTLPRMLEMGTLSCILTSVTTVQLWCVNAFYLFLRWPVVKDFLMSYTHGCGDGRTCTRTSWNMWNTASLPLTWNTTVCVWTRTTTIGSCLQASVSCFLLSCCDLKLSYYVE